MIRCLLCRSRRSSWPGGLNLHRVFLTVFSYNTAAIAMYEKLGFTREGAYREHLQRDGQRFDRVVYGILREEWEKRSSARAKT